MLMVDRFLEAIRQKGVRKNILVPKHVHEKLPSLAKLMKAAHKFDFGKIPMEKSGPNSCRVPSVNRDERLMWVDGFIPLPFEYCWYEFIINNDRAGVLIRDFPEYWEVLRFDEVHTPDSGVIYCWDGLTIRMIKECTDRGTGAFEIEVSGQGEAMEETERDLTRRNAQAAVGALVLWLSLMMYSRSTERSVSKAPEKVNAKRIRNGKEPISSHTIITIVPNKYIPKSERGEGGTGRSVRLHWVRSSRRHFDHHTPGSKWCPQEVWNDRVGWFVTVVIAHVRGKAELGTITSEYRVR